MVVSQNFNFTAEVIVGTYDEYVMAAKISSANGEWSMSKSFSEHSHCGSIRTVSASMQHVVSGGTDELVQIFDMTSRQHEGSLHHADGSINSLTFTPDGQYLLTGCGDGKIYVLHRRRPVVLTASGAKKQARLHEWHVVKTLAGKHDDCKAVLDLALHPSAKLALSVGEDCKLVTWNMVKGRPAYVTNLRKIAGPSAKPVVVKFSPDGSLFVVGFTSGTIQVSDVGSATERHVWTRIGRITDLEWLWNSAMLAVTSNQSPDVSVYNVNGDSQSASYTWLAHDSRIKCIRLLRQRTKNSVELVTASNDGWIRVWELVRSDAKPGRIVRHTALTSINLGARITCLALYMEEQPDGDLEPRSPL